MFILIPADIEVPVARTDVGLSMALGYPFTLDADEKHRFHLPPLDPNKVLLNARAHTMATKWLGEVVYLAGDVVLELPDEEGHRIIAADLLARTQTKRRASVQGVLEAMHKQALDYFEADYPDREQAAWKVVWKDLGDLLGEMHPNNQVLVDPEPQIIAVIDLG